MCDLRAGSGSSAHAIIYHRNNVKKKGIHKKKSGLARVYIWQFYPL